MDDFSVVCQMYYHKVYRFLLSRTGNVHQAEDLTQETFYRALLHIGQYRDDGHMYTWLCTIGKNAWLSECRRRKRLVSLEDAPEQSVPGPEQALSEQEMRLTLRQALLTLPEDYLEVVLLHVYGGMTLRTVAARRGKSESWARVIFYRAKQKLRREMGDFNELRCDPGPAPTLH